MKIIKRKIPKTARKKYGWKSPYYYEIKKGKTTYGVSGTYKGALKVRKKLL